MDDVFEKHIENRKFEKWFLEGGTEDRIKFCREYLKKNSPPEEETVNHKDQYLDFLNGKIQLQDDTVIYQETSPNVVEYYAQEIVQKYQLKKMTQYDKNIMYQCLKKNMAHRILEEIEKNGHFKLRTENDLLFNTNNLIMSIKVVK